MKKSAKFRFLNAMLAAGSPFANDICADAASGISAAISDGEANAPLGEFAKRMLRLYDSNARVEVLDFEGSHFDPLFVFSAVSDCAKRMSGYGRGILVVSSLERAGIPEGGRMSAKRRREYSGNMETLEAMLLRYQKSFSNVEIIFI